MPRLLLATLIAVGLVAPPVGLAPEADAQAWKVKRSKNRTKASAKRSSSDAPPRATRSSRKKTDKRSRRQRVELVPDDDEAPRRDGRLTGERDDGELPPAIIKVEEVFD